MSSLFCFNGYIGLRKNQTKVTVAKNIRKWCIFGKYFVFLLLCYVVLFQLICCCHIFVLFLFYSIYDCLSVLFKMCMSNCYEYCSSYTLANEHRGNKPNGLFRKPYIQKHGDIEITQKETTKTTRTKQTELKTNATKNKALVVWTPQNPGLSSGAP